MNLPYELWLEINPRMLQAYLIQRNQARNQ